VHRADSETGLPRELWSRISSWFGRESFSTGVLAALSHSLRALLAERGHLTAAAPLADELMAEVPTAVAPLAEEVPMLAAEPWGRRLRRQQTGTSALLVLRQERRACRIGALRRKGALTSACAGLPMMMIEGCEPAAGDPVAMNHGNFLFAGCDVPYRSRQMVGQLGMGQFNSSSQRIRCQRARLTSYSRWLDATDRLTAGVVVV